MHVSRKKNHRNDTIDVCLFDGHSSTRESMLFVNHLGVPVNRALVDEKDDWLCWIICTNGTNLVSSMKVTRYQNVTADTRSIKIAV